MNCQEFVDFVLDYFDENLEEAIREHFDKHLEECPPCLKYLRTYELTIRLGRAAAIEQTAQAGAVPDELVEAVLAAHRQKKRE